MDNKVNSENDSPFAIPTPPDIKNKKENEEVDENINNIKIRDTNFDNYDLANELSQSEIPELDNE